MSQIMLINNFMEKIMAAARNLISKKIEKAAHQNPLIEERIVRKEVCNRFIKIRDQDRKNIFNILKENGSEKIIKKQLVSEYSDADKLYVPAVNILFAAISIAAEEMIKDA